MKKQSTPQDRQTKKQAIAKERDRMMILRGTQPDARQWAEIRRRERE